MKILLSLGVAVSFLTRVPIRATNAQPQDYGRSVMWFPLVGLSLGCVLGGVAQLLGEWLEPGLRAVIVVALSAAISGALHLDGLADTFDALGGGQGDRQRMLAIMKDSRIGAHGSVALMLAVVAQIFATADLVQTSALWPIVIAPVVARGVVVPLIVLLPYARREGLGSAFNGQARPWHALVAVGIVGAVLATIGPVGWVCGLAAVLTGSSFALWMRRHLGGLTGDVYGAVIVLSEVSFLVVATACDGRPG